MSNHDITAIHKHNVIPVFDKPNKQTLFKNLRATAAAAAGIEALANQAIEEKDNTDSLEHIAELSNQLKEQISRLSLLVTELEPNQ